MPRPHSPPARPAAALLDAPSSAVGEQPDTTEAQPAPRFVLNARQDGLSAEGVAAALPAGDAASLPARVKAFFAAEHPGPGLLVGVLPFDRTQHDHLFQPETVHGQNDGPVLTVLAEPQRSPLWTITPQPSASEFGTAVQRAVELIHESQRSDASGEQLQKVVLSRSLLLNAPHSVDPYQLAQRLAGDTSITTFVAPLPSAGVQRTLVGATPELLVAKAGQRVTSHPLAGSARRHHDTAADQASAAQLLRSDKDQREHLSVVEAILDTLAPYCRRLKAPARPTLVSTASMWHLGTLIEGELRDTDISCAELVSALHPTPAVCGSPRERARQIIQMLEPVPRGFYAGAVGWLDAQGDGAWYVSIRCAEASGSQLRLHAGAGIVDGSEPAHEIRETAAKFVALLQGLGLDERVLHQFLDDIQ